MARTSSQMVPLGTPAPEFVLPDTLSPKLVSLMEVRGEKATFIMFICNHCPFVQHVNAELVKLANHYQPKGISFVAISSNDVESYPEDGPAKMQEIGRNLGYPFPYLYDETQEIARAYNAVCTPDFFLYDRDLVLVYRGQIDDSRPGNGVAVSGKDIRAAFDNLINGRPVQADQKPGIGCNIKWKK